MKRVQEAITRMLVLCVRFYQIFLSPLKPKTCRFYPTCSAYAIEALQKHGAFKGSYLTIRRLLKCHPFHEGGVDLVPEKESKKDGTT